MEGFAGRVALGMGTSGTGRASAHRLAQSGAKVLAQGIDPAANAGLDALAKAVADCIARTPAPEEAADLMVYPAADKAGLITGSEFRTHGGLPSGIGVTR